MVSGGENDASVWRLEVLLSIIVAKTIQAVDAIRDIWNMIALKQQLGHHLPTMQWVTGCLCQHNGVGHTALKSKKEVMVISVTP